MTGTWLSAATLAVSLASLTVSALGLAVSLRVWRALTGTQDAGAPATDDVQRMFEMRRRADRIASMLRKRGFLRSVRDELAELEREHKVGGDGR